MLEKLLVVPGGYWRSRGFFPQSLNTSAMGVSGCMSVSLVLLFEVANSCFKEWLVFVAGNVFGDIFTAALGVTHFP